ncbi:TetR/AcrR family transcriptional regulator [Leptolyngbyaceae cyanobacterium CCMR0082]|uniref:TetR/AcrR family transcriptional regulator n=2 Tax=Adonisia turfae TaxID=2950184 RepID=A0A6M0SBJ6_9CYAN|nr:TetR/AcrR family transcriptional regulator [Leptothoe sp. LEGE 181152]NEZ56998.1 TetR/AcrR family transcriptional regulator [Adonisia turfae CCMR0081]NEZ65878.1 TetR/AcrR family transcriptional regulator [Adonisia turfae CCMR0082]
MSKAQTTKAHIIQQAAVVFNQQGYAGTSMADIMQTTGLKKGGIYNHFSSKDELALAAFDFTVGLVAQQYKIALQGKRHSIERLKVIIETFCSMVDKPAFKGGCPLMNTAIESDDTHPTLRDRTCQAMDNWRQMIRKIISLGIKHGEIKSSLNADATTTIVISTLEGALMMSHLYGDHVHLSWAKQHLFQYIATLQQTDDSTPLGLLE